MIKVNSRDQFLIAMSKILPLQCIGVEIGVLNGEFSKQILEIINPKLLTLVDPYKRNGKSYGEKLNYSPTAYSTEDDYQNLIKKFYDEILSGKIKVIRKFSYEAVETIPDHTYDFIYLDGSHLYEDVKKDLNDWLPKFKNDTIISGHDYIEFEGFGVMDAVNEFIEEHRFEMILFNSNGGDWALKRIKIILK